MRSPSGVRLAAAMCLLFVSPLYSKGAAETGPAAGPLVLTPGETPVVFGPHEHSVEAVAWSPDGRTIATGSDDGRIRLWDAADGTLLAVLADDVMRGIRGLGFSGDGTKLAVVGSLLGQDVLLWDIATGSILAGATTPLSGDATMVYRGAGIRYRTLDHVLFSGDGRVLVTAGDGVTLRDPRTGAPVNVIVAGGTGGLDTTQDGRLLATATGEHGVHLWSLPDGAATAELGGPAFPVTAVAMSSDGGLLVGAGNAPAGFLDADRRPRAMVWVWDRRSGGARGFEVGRGAVRDVVLAGPDTAVVASGTEVLLVELRGGSARRLARHSGEVLDLAVSPDGRSVASGSADRSVDVIDVATGGLRYRLPGLNDIVSSMAASPDGKLFATATMDIRFSTRRLEGGTTFAQRYAWYFGDGNADRMQPGMVRVWSTRDGGQMSVLPTGESQVTAVSFVPGTDQLAAAGWSPEGAGFASVWDLAGASGRRDLGRHPSEVLALAVSGDGRWAATGDADGTLGLWDLGSGAGLWSLRLSGPVEAVAFTPDGRQLAATDGPRTVRIADTADGRALRTLRSRSDIESLAFSAGRGYLAAGTRSPGLELWEPPAVGAGRTLRADGDYFAVMPGYLAFSPDGGYVVAGGHGKNIAVFDTATGKLHVELVGHWHGSTAATFLPDGRLLSGAEERTVRLWDPAEGKLLVTWFTAPEDKRRGWGDVRLALASTGTYGAGGDVGRLAGWLTAGDHIGPVDAERRRLVGNPLGSP